MSPDYRKMADDDAAHANGAGPADDGDTTPADWTDAQAAAAFALHIAGRYLYVATWRRWLRWDGRRWATDGTESVYEEARRWVIDQLHAALDAHVAESVQRTARSFRARSKVEAIVTMARRMQAIAIDAQVLDADHGALNCLNGVVNLRTGAITPHDPSQRHTKLAGARYVPGAVHGDVATALAALDVEPLRFVQTFIGYSATGHTSEDAVVIFDGPGGNGKTTVLVACTAALGDYASPVDPRLIMQQRHEDHPTIKADLRGRRLVFISETPEGGYLNAERLKSLSGGEPIKARFIGADYFQFDPTHKIIVATNHRPRVGGNDDAIWRRLHLVPFTRLYRSPERMGGGTVPVDKGLRDRVQRGAGQREATLAWVVEGAIRWHADGLMAPPAIVESTDEWRDQEDAIVRFSADRLAFDPALALPGKALYIAYTDWCRGEGMFPKSNKNFARESIAHASVRDRVSVVKASTTLYKGIGLTSAF